MITHSKLAIVTVAIAASPPRKDRLIVFARWRLYVPHLIHGSLDPREFPRNDILIGSIVFAGLMVVTETERHTDAE